MAKYKIGTDLYDLPEEKVESFLSKYPDAVEVTDEIQEPVTEGKTNGAVAKGATATPLTKHTQHLSLIHISEPTRPY